MDNKTNINWYPGHMAKTKREIQEKINLIDIVLEVIDARIPYSSKNKEITSMIKNKPRILIMTKTDLCDTERTNKWKTYYQKEGYEIVMLDLIHDKKLNQLLEITNKYTNDMNNKRKEITVETHNSKNKKIILPILIYLSSYIIYERYMQNAKTILRKQLNRLINMIFFFFFATLHPQHVGS